MDEFNKELFPDGPFDFSSDSDDGTGKLNFDFPHHELESAKGELSTPEKNDLHSHLDSLDTDWIIDNIEATGSSMPQKPPTLDWLMEPATTKSQASDWLFQHSQHPASSKEADFLSGKTEQHTSKTKEPGWFIGKSEHPITKLPSPNWMTGTSAGVNPKEDDWLKEGPIQSLQKSKDSDWPKHNIASTKTESACLLEKGEQSFSMSKVSEWKPERAPPKNLKSPESLPIPVNTSPVTKKEPEWFKQRPKQTSSIFKSKTSRQKSKNPINKTIEVPQDAFSISHLDEDTDWLNQKQHQSFDQMPHWKPLKKSPDWLKNSASPPPSAIQKPDWITKTDLNSPPLDVSNKLKRTKSVPNKRKKSQEDPAWLTDHVGSSDLVKSSSKKPRRRSQSKKSTESQSLTSPIQLSSAAPSDSNIQQSESKSTDIASTPPIKEEVDLTFDPIDVLKKMADDLSSNLSPASVPRTPDSNLVKQETESEVTESPITKKTVHQDIDNNINEDNVNDVFEAISSDDDLHENTIEDVDEADQGSMNDDYTCNVCKFTLDTKQNLVDHMNIHVDMVNLKCQMCHKVFKQSSISRHMLTHTTYKEFACSICGKKFRQSGGLDRHMKSHTCERPHKCEECNKTFKFANDLLRHSCTHTGIKPYECSECHKKFAQLGHLRRHERTHTGEKPFKCSECDKTFAQSSVLETHKLVHTKQMPHTCTDCGQHFSRVHHLRFHIKSVHNGERNFRCQICPRFFSDNRNLKNHQKLHEGNIGIKCDACGGLFRFEHNVKTHHKDCVQWLAIHGPIENNEEDKPISPRASILAKRRKSKLKSEGDCESEEVLPTKVRKCVAQNSSNETKLGVVPKEEEVVHENRGNINSQTKFEENTDDQSTTSLHQSTAEESVIDEIGLPNTESSKLEKLDSVEGECHADELKNIDISENTEIQKVNDISTIIPTSMKERSDRSSIDSSKELEIDEGEPNEAARNESAIIENAADDIEMANKTAENMNTIEDITEEIPIQETIQEKVKRKKKKKKKKKKRNDIEIHEEKPRIILKLKNIFKNAILKPAEITSHSDDDGAFDNNDEDIINESSDEKNDKSEEIPSETTLIVQESPPKDLLIENHSSVAPKTKKSDLLNQQTPICTCDEYEVFGECSCLENQDKDEPKSKKNRKNDLKSKVKLPKVESVQIKKTVKTKKVVKNEKSVNHSDVDKQLKTEKKTVKKLLEQKRKITPPEKIKSKNNMNKEKTEVVVKQPTGSAIKKEEKIPPRKDLQISMASVQERSSPEPKQVPMPQTSDIPTVIQPEVETSSNKDEPKKETLENVDVKSEDKKIVNKSGEGSIPGQQSRRLSSPNMKLLTKEEKENKEKQITPRDRKPSSTILIDPFAMPTPTIERKENKLMDDPVKRKFNTAIVIEPTVNPEVKEPRDRSISESSTEGKKLQSPPILNESPVFPSKKSNSQAPIEGQKKRRRINYEKHIKYNRPYLETKEKYEKSKTIAEPTSPTPQVKQGPMMGFDANFFAAMYTSRKPGEAIDSTSKQWAEFVNVRPEVKKPERHEKRRDHHRKREHDSRHHGHRHRHRRSSDSSHHRHKHRSHHRHRSKSHRRSGEERKKHQEEAEEVETEDPQAEEVDAAEENIEENTGEESQDYGEPPELEPETYETSASSSIISSKPRRSKKRKPKYTDDVEEIDNSVEGEVQNDEDLTNDGDHNEGADIPIEETDQQEDVEENEAKRRLRSRKDIKVPKDPYEQYVSEAAEASKNKPDKKDSKGKTKASKTGRTLQATASVVGLYRNESLVKPKPTDEEGNSEDAPKMSLEEVKVLMETPDRTDLPKSKCAESPYGPYTIRTHLVKPVDNTEIKEGDGMTVDSEHHQKLRSLESVKCKSTDVFLGTNTDGASTLNMSFLSTPAKFNFKRPGLTINQNSIVDKFAERFKPLSPDSENVNHAPVNTSNDSKELSENEESQSDDTKIVETPEQSSFDIKSNEDDKDLVHDETKNLKVKIVENNHENLVEDANESVESDSGELEIVETDIADPQDPETVISEQKPEVSSESKPQLANQEIQLDVDKIKNLDDITKKVDMDVDHNKDDDSDDEDEADDSSDEYSSTDGDYTGESEDEYSNNSESENDEEEDELIIDETLFPHLNKVKSKNLEIIQKVRERLKNNTSSSQLPLTPPSATETGTEHNKPNNGEDSNDASESTTQHGKEDEASSNETTQPGVQCDKQQDGTGSNKAKEHVAQIDKLKDRSGSNEATELKTQRKTHQQNAEIKKANIHSICSHLSEVKSHKTSEVNCTNQYKNETNSLSSDILSKGTFQSNPLLPDKKLSIESDKIESELKTVKHDVEIKDNQKLTNQDVKTETSESVCSNKGEIKSNEGSDETLPSSKISHRRKSATPIKQRKSTDLKSEMLEIP
ncbi:unnamed protein product [Owenia fusiformis]|uniref:Uncharacterized protein n=1 Tax=Owenia fusiformis TaxID=6347 RepID=A0A8J1XHD3_OWEFU|nr:unnamed protein product [Owenia fusiformis]